MRMVYVHELTDFQQLTGIPTGPGHHARARQRLDFVASILHHQLPLGNKILSLLGNINIDDMQHSDYMQWTVTDDASIGNWLVHTAYQARIKPQGFKRIFCAV
jgi:hypothetical protein